MKNTFKKSLRIPVQFTLTDEVETDVICATEVYINEMLEKDGIAHKFFGQLKGQAHKVTVSVTSFELKFTFTFNRDVKAYPEEMEEQMNFIVHNILRPKLHLCEIPGVESQMFFDTPAPNNFYKRNIFMEKMAFPVTSYGTNYTTADDKRRMDWANQELRQGFDDRETWNLSSLFIEWLYSRLSRYMEVTIVDVEAEKYSFKILDENNSVQEMSLTMKEAANIILDACVDYLTLHDADIEADKYKAMMSRMTYALRIWANMFPAFWW